MNINIEEFHIELMKFLDKYRVTDFHGKIRINFFNGNVTTVETVQSRKKKDFLDK